MKRALTLALLALGPVAVLADDTPAPPPPQHEFIGKGQFGFLESRGNSDATSLNANLDIQRYDGDWKNDFNNVARMPPEEVARRRAENDKIKQTALEQRKKAGVA